MVGLLPLKKHTFSKRDLSTDDLVIVDYEGTAFPGKVTKLLETSLMVITMQNNTGRIGWKWPKLKDVCAVTI